MSLLQSHFGSSVEIKEDRNSLISIKQQLGSKLDFGELARQI